MVNSLPLFSVLVFVIIVFCVQFARIYYIFSKSKRAEDATKKRVSEIKYLSYLTSEAANGQKSLQDCFNLYLDRLKEIVGWDYHSMFILDDSTQTLKARFTGYLPSWYIEQFSKKVLVKVGDAAVGRAAAIKQPVTINTASTDPRFSSVSAITNQIEYKSLTCVPVLGKLRVYGGFCAYSKYLNIFRSHDAQFLLTCGQLFGAIVENKLISQYLIQKTTIKP